MKTILLLFVFPLWVEWFEGAGDLLASATCPIVVRRRTTPNPISFENLHRAVERNDTKAVGDLLEEGVNPNEKFVHFIRGRTRYSLLAHAARTGVAPIVRLLLQKGANPNIKDPSSGWTVLHFAISSNSTPVIAAVLDSGAGVDARTTSGGYTALHFAASWGNDGAIDVILKYGAVLDVRNFKGETPLHSSAWAGMVHTMKHLIEKGANKYALDNLGCSLVGFARRSRNPNAVAFALSQRGESPIVFKIP